MKEIEILVEVISPKEEVLKKLSAFLMKGEKAVLDIYYTDVLRENLQPTASGKLRNAFRLRKKSGKAFMAYKIDHFNEGEVWSYSDEYEVEISDFDKAERIIANLGLIELVRIENLKHTYETDDFEVVFEEVIGLGNFLEVELLKQVADDGVEKAKKDIRSFITSLDIKVSDELNAGKPELMLKRKRLW